MRRCFVAQPFNEVYNKLYESVYAPAIWNAKLEPYRVDLDKAVNTIHGSIEEQIPLSAAMLAEITTKNPNVFLELGYAIAVGKPLCIVCARPQEQFPFDIRNRPIIEYDADLSDDKKDVLRRQITDRLIAITDNEETREELEVHRFAQGDAR
jgi:hypothetical protein